MPTTISALFNTVKYPLATVVLGSTTYAGAKHTFTILTDASKRREIWNKKAALGWLVFKTGVLAALTIKCAKDSLKNFK